MDKKAPIFIGLGNGKVIDILNPADYESLTLGWIIDSLANIRRFSGRGTSVLNHSYACYEFCKASIGLNDVAISALVHDFSEAFIGDIINPVKDLFPELSVIENTVMQNIQHRFSLPATQDFSYIIKMVDLLALETEAKYVVGWEDAELCNITNALANEFTKEQRDMMAHFVCHYNDKHQDCTIPTEDIIEIIDAYRMISRI